MTTARRELPLALGLLALVAVTALLRPIIPVDETRYLGVAWEMWNRGDFLVPFQNGAPYSQKPPLLFWLIHAGWAVFGVNAWWPRLMPALFAAGCLLLIPRLARLLWPQRSEVAAMAPLILASFCLWTVFATAIMFDMMLAFFVLLGYVGLAHAWRTGKSGGFALFAIGLAGGLFSKGPVALLHLLPVALLAPLWATVGAPKWGRWYVGVLLGVLAGAAAILAWAVPAAISGGPAYSQAIFWGQTAGRVTRSFAHREPFWFFLPVLPLMLAPWSVWPPLWRGASKASLREPAVRFCLSGLVVAFIGFSIVSGKQAQYLLPESALFAVLFARWAASQRAPARRWDAALPAAFIAIAGLAVAFASTRLPEPLAATPAAHYIIAGGAFALLVGLVLAMLPVRDLFSQAARICAASVVALAGMLAAVTLAFRPAWDLAPAGARLRELQLQHVPLAHEDVYHGQFHFAGRLVAPIQPMTEEEIGGWLQQHPHGRAVVYYEHEPYAGPGRMEYSQPYRSRRLAIVTGATSLPSDGAAAAKP